MYMHDGSWMLPMWGMMMFFWLGLIVLVAWLVVRLGRPYPFAGGDDLSAARRILAERYARGEVDHDEYDQRLRKLTRHQP